MPKFITNRPTLSECRHTGEDLERRVRIKSCVVLVYLSGIGNFRSALLRGSTFKHHGFDYVAGDNACFSLTN